MGWYTRQTFIYQLINRALRTEDIDALYFFRPHISDMCRQLADKSKHFREKLMGEVSSRFTVYRGSGMNADELAKLKEIKGKQGAYTSINGFISTSENEAVAKRFIKHPSIHGSKVKPVLWTIEVDPRTDGVIFANISDESIFLAEKEVLFNIGTTFSIDDITLDQATQVWNIKATATNGGVKAADDYLTLVREELHETSVEIILGILLIDMGKYVTARKYYLDLMKRTSDANGAYLAVLHYYLGIIDIFERDLDLAECHFLQALHYLNMVSVLNKWENMVRVHNALGYMYQLNGELKKAISCYIRAESFCQDSLGIDHRFNAQTYSQMGQCYLIKGMHLEAMKYYLCALSILQIHLPRDHHRLGILFDQMGTVCRKQGALDQALNYYLRADAILRYKLPHYHPCIAYCWSNMGILYLQAGNVEEARYYHQHALETYQRVLPADHINIRISENNLHCDKIEHIIDSYLEVCSHL